MKDRVPSGIQGLDEVVEGGFPKGSLILLAGNLGTGKTSFSSKFLVSGAESGEPGVYVLFTEDKDFFISNVSRHLDCNLKGLIDKGKVSILDLTSLRGEGVSANIDTIVSEIENLDAKRLVIDSFTAMAQALKEPVDVRIIVHNILSRLTRGMGCTTIMIEEVPLGESKIGLGLEEFLADGVIMLGTGELDGRLLRYLSISKLRGTRLLEQQLPFTLEGGFRILPPLEPKIAKASQRYRPTPDSPNRFSTGSRDLDEMLGGGFPKGSNILFEATERFTTSEYTRIILPIALNFLTQGRGIMLVPTVGMDADFCVGILSSFGIAEKEINRLLRFCELPTPGRNQAKPHIAVFEGNDIQKDYERWLRLESELMQNTGQPVLTLSGLDTLANIFGPEVCSGLLSQDIARIRSRGTIGILIAKPGYEELVRKLSIMAEIHLKLAKEHDSILLYGMKPRTNLYAVEMEISSGYPMPRLTPII